MAAHFDIDCTFLTLARVTGGEDDHGEPRDEILEYKVGRWRNLGSMKDSRAAHGTSIINFNDFTNCN